MAGRLQDIAAQQQAVLARVKTLNRGTMPMTTAGIHPDLVRQGLDSKGFHDSQAYHGTGCARSISNTHGDLGMSGFDSMCSDGYRPQFYST